MTDKQHKSDAEWRKTLTPEQFHILREKGTERAYTGRYDKTTQPGEYHCAACGQLLFESDAKFDSGCGWPAFAAPADGAAVESIATPAMAWSAPKWSAPDVTGTCHVFPDGPGPAGLRYCINSAALDFEPED